jgi:hypothetical protein
VANVKGLKTSLLQFDVDHAANLKSLTTSLLQFDAVFTMWQN